MLRVRRAAATALVTILLLAGAERAGPAEVEAQRAAAGRDPILFVHGWRGDRAQWRTMVARFRADGWRDAELFTWTYDSDRPNAAAAARLAARVEQILVATRASRVDIVAHSMGALPARYYLKRLGGGRNVDAWVSLGAPNHGTTTAEVCFSASCREMRPGSSFLAALNVDDETPGAARYATWWSPCDEIIDPDSSALLRGAANHRTACIGHLDFLRDAAVYREVRDFVSRPDSARTAANDSR